MKKPPNGVFGLLLPKLGRAVSEAGYHTPSPIQEQSIPSLLQGRDMGFIHDIRKIIARLPEKRQSLFFSAMMEPEVVKIARTLVANPVHRR